MEQETKEDGLIRRALSSLFDLLADLQQVRLGGQCSSAAGVAADDLRRSS